MAPKNGRRDYYYVTGTNGTRALIGPSDDDSTEDEGVEGDRVESGSIGDSSEGSIARGDDNDEDSNSDHVSHENNTDRHNEWHALSSNGPIEGGKCHHRCHARLQKHCPTADETEPSKPAPTAISEAQFQKNPTVRSIDALPGRPETWYQV